MHITRNTGQWLLVAVIYFLLLLDWAARVHHWYWTYFWFDMVTHSLGGLWIGLATLWLVYLSGYLRSRTWSDKQALLFVLGGALSLGVVWELYECIVQVASGIPFAQGYAFDTAKDITMDTVGALVGYFFFVWGVRRGEKNKITT